MIAYLEGVLLEKSPASLLILCNGVGYEVHCTTDTAAKLPTGSTTKLYIRTIIREDAHTLYGFPSPFEREVFDKLLGVKGVGPKTALGILSGVGIDVLLEAIRAGDTKLLNSFPNVGKKTAELLVVELRDKLLKEEFSGGAGNVLSSGGDKTHVRNDALQALMSLGYPRATAEKAIRQVIRDTPEHGNNSQDLVKAALKAAMAG